MQLMGKTKDTNTATQTQIHLQIQLQICQVIFVDQLNFAFVRQDRADTFSFLFISLRLSLAVP